MNNIFDIIFYIFKRKVSILKTIYFNFHYFSIKTAIKFPVIIYKNVRFRKTLGQLNIISSSLKPGLIHIGKRIYGFQWKNDYTILEHLGGTINLGEDVCIGQGTFISVGEKAVLSIGRNVTVGGDDRIICMESININANTKIAWDVHIVDTDFKQTFNTILKTRNIKEKKIIIGNDNWLCFGCSILKGSVTPNNTIIGAKTIINKDFSSCGDNIAITNSDNSNTIIKNIRLEL